MNTDRRGFLKFLSTATVAFALPAIGAAPALGVQLPGYYADMQFDRPISAPPGSRFERCSFSAEAGWHLPPDCSFFSCHFHGPVRITGPLLPSDKNRLSYFRLCYLEGT